MNLIFVIKNLKLYATIFKNVVRKKIYIRFYNKSECIWATAVAELLKFSFGVNVL